MANKNGFIDFKLIKERISLPQAIQILGIQMRLKGNQYRSECPTCKHGGDRALAVTIGEGFYCHSFGKGGDVIAFVAHVRDEGQREAAEFLAQYAGMDNSPNRSPAPAEQKGEALKPLDYLVHEHEVLELLGLSPAVCEALGAGYAPKGTMNGRVLIPLHTKEGKLIGYMGIATRVDQTPLIKFPSNLEEMCQVTVTESAEPSKSKDELRKLLRVV
jgi:DNA primase